VKNISVVKTIISKHGSMDGAQISLPGKEVQVIQAGFIH
jgi:hypothetical protein